MMYFWYTFLSKLFMPFAFKRLKKKSQITPAYAEHWDERKGIVPFELKPCIWIHAVSLGESIAAEPIIKKLIADYPNERILITNTTPTGREFIEKKFGDQVHNCYFPYDLPGYWERFFSKVSPKILLLIETELWPNLLKILHEKKIPSMLINARLSQRSKDKYGNFAKISKSMLNNLGLIVAQTEDDARRFAALGKDPKQIKVTGSMKFDLSIPEGLAEKSAEFKKTVLGERPIWIAASTHDGEEQYILNVHQQVLKTIPNALLMLVPRHPERFDSVKSLCEKEGLKVVTRSSGQNCSPETNVFLGDTMGEMMLFYGACDAAFVGGSLVATGGHNLLEPAALKKPGLTGPYVFNFQVITDGLVKAGGAVMVQEPAALTTEVLKLLQDADYRKQMGEAGYQVVEKNRGALERQYGLVKQELSKD